MQDIIQELNIENMIYEIRGKQVMLDSDLARLYNVETKRVNESVKRNIDKFPKRFSWLLTNEEIDELVLKKNLYLLLKESIKERNYEITIGSYIYI